jgi:hypothetical protein
MKRLRLYHLRKEIKKKSNKMKSNKMKSNIRKLGSFRITALLILLALAMLYFIAETNRMPVSLFPEAHATSSYQYVTSTSSANGANIGTHSNFTAQQTTTPNSQYDTLTEANVQTYPKSFGSTSTTASFCLDGSVSNTTGSSSSYRTIVSLTTTNSSDVIIISAGTYNTTALKTVSSISSSIKFTKRKAWNYTASGHYTDEEEWYNNSASAGTYKIVISWSGKCTDYDVVAFGITGANNTTPYDSNSALPAHASKSSTNPTLKNCSTTNANDMLLGLLSDTAGTPSAETGFTAIKTGSYYGTEYKIVTSAQTSVYVNFTDSSSGYWALLADAVKKSNYYYSSAANELDGGRWTCGVNVTTINDVKIYGAALSGSATSIKAVILSSSRKIITNGISAAKAVTTTAGWWNCTFSTQPTISASTNYWLMVIPNATFLIYFSSAFSGIQLANSSNSFASPKSPTNSPSGNDTFSMYANTTAYNYRLSLGEQWTNANYTLPNRQLCIKMGTYSGSPSETIGVQWWNTTSSSWVTIISSLTASAWNNVSVTMYLTSSTFTIRFVNGTQSNVGTQYSWNVYCALIHTWSNTYNLNLRVQDYAETKNIANAIVTMNNGSNQVKTSNSNGWANYTGVSGSVTVSVKYFGYSVNYTSSTVSSNTNINLKCNLYNVVITCKETLLFALLYNDEVKVLNSSGSLITSGKTTASGTISLSDLPNNTLTFTQYGGASYTIVVGNATQSVTSQNQNIALSATQNSITSTGNDIVLASIH